MKIVNIVLSALILVLALVCTVFSFFLFQKRTDMVKGWDTMAASISTASTNLGKPVAKDALDFKTGDSSRMTATTNTLVSESKKVFDQRNGLAADIQVIAKAARFEEKDVPSAEQLISQTGNAGKDAENKEVTSVTLIANKVAGTAKALDIEKAEHKNNIAAIAKSAGAKPNRKAIISRITKYQRDLRNTRDNLKNTQNQLAKTEKDLKDEKKARAKVEANLKAELRAVKNQRDNALKAQDEAERMKDAEIRKCEQALAKVMADYKRVTAEDYGVTPVLKDGSPEVRAKVKGTVRKVDPKNGYIVIDLSTSTRIDHKIGKVVKHMDPKFKKGDELVVVRNNAEGKPQFIARIKINSIDDKCSVANIPADKVIQLGDTVIDNSSYDVKSLKK